MRLFVAINFPADLREALWRAAQPLREAGFPIRWVGPEELHLTLKFLGEVAADREPELVACLDAAVRGAKPFVLPVGGFGAFPTASRPRVVWAGCEPLPALEWLQHRVEHEMHQLGFPLEGRAFRPHLTLGRARRDTRAADFRELEDRLNALAFAAEALVSSVDLMQSHLTPGGAHYTRRYAAALVP
jgi:2'-5' RNA ligase